MEFRDALRKRRMVRSFTDEPVPMESVRRIVDAGRRAPSAGHSQGVEFVVVTDPAIRAAIAAPGDEMLAASGHHNFVAQAPVHVVVCVNPDIYRGRYREADKQRAVADIPEDELWAIPYWYHDAGAAVMLLLLAAVDEGLAAAYVGGGDGASALLGIPEAFQSVGIVLLGHKAADADSFGDVSAVTRKRRPFEEVVHFDHW